MTPELLAALRGCQSLGILGPYGDLLHIAVSYPPGFIRLAARRGVLEAIVRGYGPLKLVIEDPEDREGLDALGIIEIEGGRLIPPDVDLDALELAALHVGGWLLYRSRHPDLLPLIGDRDVLRTPVLAELAVSGDIDVALAAFFDDREWLLALPPSPT